MSGSRTERFAKVGVKIAEAMILSTPLLTAPPPIAAAPRPSPIGLPVAPSPTIPEAIPSLTPESASSKPAEVLRHIPDENISPGVKPIAITIDDGGNSWVNEAINISKEFGIPLTFCPTGDTLNNPTQQKYIKDAVATGRIELCNHTYNHDMGFLNGTDAQIKERIIKDENAVHQALGDQDYKMRYFRPPGGAGVENGQGNSRLKRILGEMGYENILMWDTELLWTFDEGNMKGVPYTVNNVANYLLGEIRSGHNLILLHFKAVDIQALRQIVPILQQEGYIFTFADGSVPMFEILTHPTGPHGIQEE